MAMQTLHRYIAWASGQIARVLNQNKIAGRFGNGVQSPQLLTWQIDVSSLDNASVARLLALDRALQMALRCDKVRVALRAGIVSIEMPSPGRERRALPSSALPKRRGLAVPLGVTMMFKPFALDLNENPHLLVIGATKAAGKTETLRTLAWSLARQNRPSDTRLVFVDMKNGRDFDAFGTLAHTEFPIAKKADQARAVIAWLIEQMDRRMSEAIAVPQIFLFIDEIYVLTQEWSDADKYLGRLAAVARGASIHLIAATQRANRETLASSMVAANVLTRIVGAVDNANSAHWAMGMPGSGAERLLGKGDVLVRADGALTRVQIGLTADAQIAALPQGTPRAFPQCAVAEVARKQHGGQNRITDFPAEWLEHFKNGGTITAFRRLYRDSASVACNARDAAMAGGMQ